MYVCMYVCYATLTCMHTYILSKYSTLIETVPYRTSTYSSIHANRKNGVWISAQESRDLAVHTMSDCKGAYCIWYSYGKYVYSYMHVHYSGTVSHGFWQRQENIRSKGIHHTRGHCRNANKGENLVNYYLLLLLLLLLALQVPQALLKI